MAPMPLHSDCTRKPQSDCISCVAAGSHRSALQCSSVGQSNKANPFCSVRFTTNPCILMTSTTLWRLNTSLFPSHAQLPLSLPIPLHGLSSCDLWRHQFFWSLCLGHPGNAVQRSAMRDFLHIADPSFDQYRKQCQ